MDRTNRYGQHYDLYLARRDLHAYICILVHNYADTIFHSPSQLMDLPHHANVTDLMSEATTALKTNRRGGFIRTLLGPIVFLTRWLRTVARFGVLMLIAEPKFQRELVYVMKGRWFPVRFLLTKNLDLCTDGSKKTPPILYGTTLIKFPTNEFYGRPRIYQLVKVMKKGVVTIMGKNKITIDSLDGRPRTYPSLNRQLSAFHLLICSIVLSNLGSKIL